GLCAGVAAGAGEVVDGFRVQFRRPAAEPLDRAGCGRQRDRDAGGDSAWWRFVQHPGVVAEERLTRHWLDTRQVEGLPCRIGMRCGKQYSGDKVVDVDRGEDALAAGGQDQAALLDLLDR